MSIATIVKTTNFRTAYGYQSLLCTAPTILASTAEEITIPLASYAGRIEALRVVCASLNYDLYIMDKIGINPTLGNSIYQLYSKTGINTVCNEVLNILFANQDTISNKKIYLYLDNKDAVNATGTISMEWVIQRM